MTTGGLGPRWLVISGVAAATLVLDQLTKWWAITALADGHVVPVVWTLQLALHQNTGAAFSLGRDSDWVRFLPVLVLVAVGVIVWRSRSTLSTAGAIAVGLIVGGAVGNLIDRALRTDGGGFFSGGVIDFIDVQWWPVFNVADTGVVIGGLLFALVAVGASPARPRDDPAAGDAGDGARADPGPDRSAGGGEPNHPRSGLLPSPAADRLADADSPS